MTDTIRLTIIRGKKAVLRKIALISKHWYQAQSWIGGWKVRYSGAVLILSLVVSTSIYLLPTLQNLLECHYATDQALEGLRSLILSIGSALLGATAIVSSLVLFAMQVNIERMPHGLFRRLSADPKLFGVFALAFLLAIAVATLSTYVVQSSLAIVVLAASLAIFIILILFICAYRRALALIDPLRQLEILIHDTQRDLGIWSRRAKRAIPLLEQEDGADILSSSTTHDTARTTFFLVNKHWADGAKRAIQHAMSYARRYAEQGDYEVSRWALNAVVGINKSYIEVKGRTFYANNLFADNPLASDDLINDTLEHMRQNLQKGIARRDEQQIEQTLQSNALLVGVYLGIDYSSPRAPKSHAHLAGGYLASAVQAVVPHDMADVLLEGLRLMGRSAQGFLAVGNPNDISTLSEKIALIACTGSANEKYHVVTMEGVTQLANLTYDLLRSPNRNIGFAVEKVRQSVSLVVKLFLNVPEPPLTLTHSTVLGPYYSSTTEQSLLIRLTKLINALSEAEPDDTNAQTVVQNIRQWADGLYTIEKELLLAAIKSRSHFTLSMIGWITGVTDILLAVSNAPVCHHKSRENLRKSAGWLIATLTWIPDDEDTVTFMENFDMTETLFELAMNARERECNKIAKKVGKILLSWTFKGGRYQTGWGVLGRGLLGLSVFAQTAGHEQTNCLKTAVRDHLSGKSAPEQNIRDQVARKILERSRTLFRQEHWGSSIEQAIARANHENLRPLLEDIAKILSPNLAH